ncbi:DoxX family protein [Agrococcus sp. DT81.2]|uniref:DoxX family protein n=1 Tax=Agrococcus sp. DT81.2 TaxID=3393414 RepID=UPI003CE57840
MDSLPDPVWPVVVLAAISAFDAVISWKPARFVADCWDDVRFPRRWWPILAPIKVAATLGLLAGIWIPWLGLVTSACLVAYFVVAIAMHVRARDLGRNLFVNATGMLVICVAVLLWSFVL